MAKRIGLAHVGHGADQEPAAAVEMQLGQLAAFGVLVEANGLGHLAVLDDLQVADRIAGGEGQADFEIERRACFGLKHVAGQFAFDGRAHQRAVGDDHLRRRGNFATIFRR